MDMSGTHIYTSTSNPLHPLHYMQSGRRTPRNIHTTPATYYRQHFLSLPPTPHNTTIRKHIHTTYTSRALNSLPPNTLLGTRPPPISPEERSLSRADRVNLSRLRCGHHPALPSYMHRIGRAPTDTCDQCHGAPGGTDHLILQCPTLQQHRDAHSIQALENLWSQPVTVVNFLRDAGVI